jgi:3-carboxy-cis,cis-muconate cycloisomerase
LTLEADDAAPFSVLSRVFGDRRMAAIFSERATIAAWLRAEAALAGAQAEVGILDPRAAEAIARAAVIENVDREELWAQAQVVGYPILPLVRMIAAAVPAYASGRVHFGATTQDIMDTGLALQAAEALDRLDELAVGLGDVLERLVGEHRGTVMAARTHGQQAVPTTFGAKLAVLLAELGRQRRRIAEARPRIARVSLYGAGGTSAALGGDAARVREAMAARLGLRSGEVPWHVARDGVAELGSLCASLAATCARFAGEVIELSRTEVGEVAEADGHLRGASSTMPQKANPVVSEAVVGMAAVAGPLSASLWRAMEARHERAAGEWQAEWESVPLLANLAAGALAGALAVASGLRVFPEEMRANLHGRSGYVMAEAQMMRLAEQVGRERAHDLVYRAVRRARSAGTSLEEALRAEGVDDESSAPIEPGAYLGEAGRVCDAALDAWQRGRRGN